MKRIPPYQKTSDTSRAAAASMTAVSPTVRERVLAFIRAQGVRGATRTEIEVGTGIVTQSACARINELCGRQLRLKLPTLVIDSGERRPGDTGRLQAVWVAVEFVAAPARSPEPANTPGRLFDDEEGSR